MDIFVEAIFLVLFGIDYVVPASTEEFDLIRMRLVQDRCFMRNIDYR